MSFAGEWGHICYGVSEFLTYKNTAAVACKQLGFTFGFMLRASLYFGKPSTNIWMRNVKCQSEEKRHFGDCAYSGFGFATTECNYDAGVACFKGK